MQGPRNYRSLSGFMEGAVTLRCAVGPQRTRIV
jgi:hypothetical protein